MDKMHGYSAPEVASGGPRGDSAHAFLLGCVFLEMFVVLTGTATLERARSCRNTAGNRSYQANLEKVRALINELLVDQRMVELCPWSMDILTVIKAMLGREPELRPQAADVWRLVVLLTTDAGGLSKVKANICGKCCLENLVV